MARYPTFEEYKSDPAKGIRKCDELLQKQPQDVSLLVTKLSLIAVTNERTELNGTIAKLVSTQTRDLNELSVIDEAVAECQRNDTYPLPLTSGPEATRLWDNASKLCSNLNARLDIHSLRFSRAIYDNRIQDAQLALIQLKALQPKNRVFYMAHAICTQLLSTAKGDLQARLALSLARKAVSEGFDSDKELDCRVTGQIFAMQNERADLDGVIGRRFAESKQVFDAMRDVQPSQVSNAVEHGDTGNAAAEIGTAAWLDHLVDVRKTDFQALLTDAHDESKLQGFAADTVRAYRNAIKAMNRFRHRNVCDLMFLAISALVRSWEVTSSQTHLLQAALLAESLLRDSPQIHEAKVFLVHLYMRLDLGALALKHWISLSVKEIQHDTIGHIFLTRLSDIHPQKIPNVKAKLNDPYETLGTALAMYDRCEASLARTEASVLHTGQTGMVVDLHALRENLRQSLSRRIFALEQRRIARITGRPMGVHIKPRLLAQWLDVRDNRDFKATFDFGYGVEDTLHGLRETKAWMLYRLAEDTIWCLCKNLSPPVTDTQVLLQHLDDVTHSLKTASGTSALTPSESTALGIAHLVLHHLLKTPTREDQIASLKSLTTQLSNLPILSTIPDASSQIPSFPLNLRAYHASASVLGTVLALTTRTANIASAPEHAALTSKTRQLLHLLSKCAAEQVGKMQIAHVRAALEMEGEVMGAVLRESEGGKKFVDGVCAEMVGAVKSGWTGVVVWT